MFDTLEAARTYVACTFTKAARALIHYVRLSSGRWQTTFGPPKDNDISTVHHVRGNVWHTKLTRWGRIFMEA